jgi:glutathione S-transferase
MLVLHNYWSSVCSQKVRLCLAEKHLPYENLHVDLFTFEQWDPGYVRLNPNGVVPALVHDGRIIIESNVIIEYLEDVFPAIRLRPEDAFAAAQMRIWMFNAEEIAHPQVNTASHNPRHAARLAKKGYTPEELRAIAARCPNPMLAARFLHRQMRGVTAAEEEAAYVALDYLLDRMEAALLAGPWLAGDAYSLADIAMAPYINRIEVLKRPEMVGAARRPRIAEWWRRVQARPAFAEAFSIANPDKSDPVAR